MKEVRLSRHDANMLTQQPKGDMSPYTGVVIIEPRYVSIVKNGNGVAIYIPARYSIHGKPEKIPRHYRTGFVFDGPNHAADVILKIEEEIDTKGKVDPLFWKETKVGRFRFKAFARETWLASKKDITDASRRQYGYVLQQILQYWGGKDLRFISKADCFNYPGTLKGSKTNKNKIIEQVNSILSLAGDLYDLKIPRVKKIARARPRSKISIADRFRNALLEDIAKLYPQHFDIFRFLFNTSTRPCEVFALRFTAINWQKKKAIISEHVSNGKVISGTKEGPNKEISLDLFDDLMPMLKRKFNTAEDKMGLVFKNQQGRIYKHGCLKAALDKVLEGKKFTVTDLARSSVITKIIKEHDTVRAMEESGHRNLTTTAKYVRLAEVSPMRKRG